MGAGACGHRALRGRFTSFAWLLAGCVSAVGCSDVGDSSAVPGQSGFGPTGDDAGEDVGETGSSASDATASTEAGADAAQSTAPDAAGLPDATTIDAGRPGTGIDATVADSGISDATTVDATDAGDAGHGLDGAAADAPADAPSSVPDANGSDAAATADARIDSGGGLVDASDGGGLLPCTSPGQTGCVMCSGNGGAGVCTPTEAAFVALDIREGTATAPGAAPMSGCYYCLWQAGCIDDATFPDTGHECSDLTGSFTAGNGTTGNAASACVATVECIATSACATINGGLDNCYCGAGGGTPSLCPANGAATNGDCKSQEVDGFLAMPSDATNTLKNYTDTTQPSGMANQIFICGQANMCFQCLQ